MNEIGERIKELRLRIGLKQSDLAEKLSVSRVTITNIENGKHKGTFELIKPLCEILGVTPNYLILGEERKITEKDELNEEGKKLLQEYQEYLKQKYPKEYKQVGNL